MNKKFSTLVAALLASGGLFYAVDAMILPAGDGVAQKYVTAITRSAIPGSYSLAVSDFSEFAASWTAEGSTSFQLKTKGAAEDCYMAKGEGDEIVLLPSASVNNSNKVEFTSKANGYIVSNSKILVEKDGKLYLKATLEDGFTALTAYTNAATPAALSATDFAIGELKVKALAVGSQKAAKFTATAAVAKIQTAAKTDDAAWEEDNATKVTIEGAKAYITTATGKKLYLTVESTSDGTAVTLTEDATAAKDITIASNLLKLDGVYLQNVSGVLKIKTTASSGVDILAFPVGDNKSAVIGNTIEAGNYYLGATASNATALSSTDVNALKMTDDASVAIANNATISSDLIALANIDKARWIVKDGKLSAYTSDFNYMTGNDAISLNASSTLTFRLGANGVVLNADGTKCLSDESNTLTLKDVATAAQPMAAFEVGHEETPATSLEEGKVYFLAEAKAADLAAGTNVVSFDVKKAINPGSDLTEAPAANEPVAVKLGTNLLIVKEQEDGSFDVETITASGYDWTDADKAAAASWYISTADNGVSTYESVLLKGQDARFLQYIQTRAVATNLTVGENASGFKLYSGDKTPASADAVTGVLGVYMGANDPLYVTTAGATTSTYGSGATLNLQASSIGNAAGENTYHSAYSLETSIGSGYYLLSIDNGQNYLTANADGVPTATSLSNILGAEYLTESSDVLKQALWKVEEVSKDDTYYYYTFINAAGKKINMGSGTLMLSAANQPYATTTGISLKDVVINGGTIQSGAGTQAVIGLYKAPEMLLNGEFLTKKLGNGFDVTIAIDKDFKKTSIEENPFTGTLTPVKSVTKTNGKIVSTLADGAETSFYLQNAAGDFVVLDTKASWSSASESLNGKGVNKRGFKFTTISAADFYAMVGGSGDADMKEQYNYQFSVGYSGSVYKAADANALFIRVYDEDAYFGKLYVATVDGKNMLTTSNKIETDGSRIENWPFIKFGGSNLTDIKTLLKGKFVTIVNANTAAKYNSKGYGKVYAINTESKAGYVDASKVLLTSPEAQWAVTKSGSQLVFTNREDPTIALTAQTLYNVEADNVYAFAGSQDTVKIEFVNNATKFDGFANMDENALRDEQFKIAAYLPVTENAYLTENHAGKHQIGLDKNAANAVIWSLTKEYAGRPDKKVSRIDTVYVVSTLGYYDGNDYKQDKKDTLAILPYIVKNDANGEYVRYGVDSNIKDNDLMKHYVCNPFNGESTLDEAGAKAAAQRFALKMKPNGTYNLVEIDQTNTKIGSYNTNTLGDLKMYAGTSENNGITNRADIYDQTENDLFVVEKMDAPEYRKVAMGDTIRIYRAENDAQVVYEKGEFLSIANAVQFPKTNPALYVDTAFVDRGNNNRWEYLLTVDAIRKVVNDECSNPSHEKFHADTTYGRFLVNLMDSANVYAETHIHDNKYINEEDGENYAKLGFVKGFHTEDTLFVERVAGKFDRLPMDRKANSHSVAKFAFRIVDQDTKSFVIETGRKDFGSSEYAEKPGYLKWLNGVLVVVDDVKKADIFNLNADETRIPTANEGINASEVSVIAKEGAVVINGAQAKKVTISNVLGQTIANTVLSSDNATISAPAGIVVVAVEGEAAVKAIVK